MSKIIVTIPEDPEDHNTGETALFNFICEEGIPYLYIEERTIDGQLHSLCHYMLPKGMAVFLDPKHVTFYNINPKAL